MMHACAAAAARQESSRDLHQERNRWEKGSTLRSSMHLLLSGGKVRRRPGSGCVGSVLSVPVISSRKG